MRRSTLHFLGGLLCWIVAIVFALWWVSLEGCAAAPELQPFEREAGRAALEGWRAAGLPEPDRHNCDVTRFYVRLASAKEALQRCGPPPTEKRTAACLNWEYSSHFFRPNSWPVVVITPNWHSEPGIIIHELMHAMIRCSDMGLAAWDPGDRGHTIPAVWIGMGGGEAAAEARARALVGGG